MLVEQRFERATSGLGLCERRQSGLNVFSHRLPGSVPGQVIDRTQCTVLTVRPGNGPSLAP